MSHEIRCLTSHELRASAAGQPLQLIGYGAIFNSLTQLPGFREKVKPGAFARSLRSGADIKCLWNHNANIVLGSSKAGTLRLAEDGRGLKFVTNLPDTRSAADYHESVRRGDVSGCSFGFMVGKNGQSWSEERDADGSYFVQRDLIDIDKLTDCGPVTYPAYDATELNARSAVEAPIELRSAVAEMNARHNYVKPRNRVFVPGVDPKTGLRVTTQDVLDFRKKLGAAAERRKKMMDTLLS